MKQSSFSMTLFWVILCCLVFVYSCKKSKGSVVKYDFSYTGFQGIDSAVSFHSTVPQGSKFLWSFGDSTYSNDSTPVHIYENDGTFVVSLTVNNDTANIIQKTITITAPTGSEYTHNMAGARKWHHVDYTMFPGDMYDTSFAVQVINKTTVKFGEVTMKYQGFSTYNGSGQLSFYNPSSGIYYLGIKLEYFIDSDSMICDLRYSNRGFYEQYVTFK